LTALHSVQQQPAQDSNPKSAAGSSRRNSNSNSASRDNMQNSSSHTQGTHLLQPSDPDVAASRQALQQFLSSKEFAALQADMQQQQQQRHRSRGILVVAGGKKLTTHVIVLLKVFLWLLHQLPLSWQSLEHVHVHGTP
jgi:hypothetical protein